jgi:hypothetical protein
MQEIIFKYKFKDDYNPVYANGAFGGVTPLGEITINFYCERHPIPYSTTHQVNEDTSLGEIINNNPEDHQNQFIRYIESGVILNLESAKRIYEWFGANIKLLEEKNNAAPGNM